MPVPMDAREMHAQIFSGEAVQLPPLLTFFLAMMLKNNQNVEMETDQLLLTEVEQKTLTIEEAMKEQTIARTLLLRFGLPYLPGAEEVWLTLSEYLANAKEATDQAQLQLKQAIEQIRALLITQLAVDQEDELRTLKTEEKEHQQGITTLQKSGTILIEENALVSQKNAAIEQKKQRLTVIAAQKEQLKNSIQSMQVMVSNLITSFTGIHQLDQTQLVMA